MNAYQNIFNVKDQVKLTQHIFLRSHEYDEESHSGSSTPRSPRTVYSMTSTSLRKKMYKTIESPRVINTQQYNEKDNKNERETIPSCEYYEMKEYYFNYLNNYNSNNSINNNNNNDIHQMKQINIIDTNKKDQEFDDYESIDFCISETENNDYDETDDYYLYSRSHAPSLDMF